ncbi:sco1-involved in stabilization of cox1p and cox2p [Lentinula edodes]|uniref:Sco1-involved in stabilization of cox1p and cox2p n=1 Tax=Lentinula edodes TaxID=5353 RepID=A0A1Q3EL42_LENED|nr:sco1-involved in stabilization of cox1p and cox2p [Lentinula edodes]
MPLTKALFLSSKTPSNTNKCTGTTFAIFNQPTNALMFEPSQPSRPSSEPSRPQRNVIGAFTPTSAAIFVVVGVGLFWYFRNEKAKLQEQRECQNHMVVRMLAAPSHWSTAPPPRLPPKSDLHMKTCSENELDKVTAVVNELRQSNPDLPLQPVFISVDPARDTPSTIRTYLTDFHPSFVGLVGNFEQTKSVCKAYRVYFSTPPDADPKGDYLVDHSIFVYLMDPEGRFVEAFGQTAEKEEMVDKIRQFVVEWSR